MKVNRDWVQIVSNVAVIVGLILVVIELNQSQRLAIVESQQNWTAIFNESVDSTINSEYLPSILTKYQNGGLDSLSGEEQMRFSLYHTTMAARMDMMFLQYQEGFLSEETYLSTFVGTIKQFGPTWKETESYLDSRRQSFREEVDRILEESTGSL